MKPERPPVQRMLLRGSEVAQALGCSRSQAYRLMKERKIPTLRITGGRAIRVPAEALAEYVTEHITAATLRALEDHQDPVLSAQRAAAPQMFKALKRAAYALRSMLEFNMVRGEDHREAIAATLEELDAALKAASAKQEPARAGARASDKQ